MSNDLSAPHSQPRRAPPGRAGQHFMITADPRCGVVSQIRKCWPGHRFAPARWSSSGPPSCKAHQRDSHDRGRFPGLGCRVPDPKFL